MEFDLERIIVVTFDLEKHKHSTFCFLSQIFILAKFCIKYEREPMTRNDC